MARRSQGCSLTPRSGPRFNHELVFGVSVKNLTKAERLMYGDSLMTHAMIITAVTDKVWQRRTATAFKQLRNIKSAPFVYVCVCACISMDLATVFLPPSRTERKAMRNGEWKTPGAMTVVIKVRH